MYISKGIKLEEIEMKVKIFTSYDEDCICTEINTWISKNSVDVVDFKYSNIADNEGTCFYTILVMYKINNS